MTQKMTARARCAFGIPSVAIAGSGYRITLGAEIVDGDRTQDAHPNCFAGR
ncbi:hypothetical protein [Reticulibacter mediterranei]|nr:hypothetical protein [Reticulibacter mediterranei]